MRTSIIIIPILICIVAANAYAQVNIPIFKGLRRYDDVTAEPYNITLQKNVKAEEIKLLSEKATMRIQEMNNDSLNQELIKINSTGFVNLQYKSKFKLLSAEDRRDIDTDAMEELKQIKEKEVQKIVDELNEETSRFQPLVTGGINNITQDGNSAAVGNLALGMQYRITAFKNKGTKIDPHYIYAVWNASTAKSDDSANIMKAVLFPEIAKNDFIVGWHRDVIVDNQIRGWYAEASFTTYKDTTNTHLFRSESFLAGYQWAVTGNIPGVNWPGGFKVQAYGNVINIDPKYNEGLEKVTNGVVVHNTFFNLGCRIQAEINKATLFFNGKYILNKSTTDMNPDFVRFVYTVGTVVSL